MDDKIIDLNQSVNEICTAHPDIMQMMINLGFTEMGIPGMLKTAGRFMTIPKGAKMRNVDLELIKQNIKDLGFTIKE